MTESNEPGESRVSVATRKLTIAIPTFNRNEILRSNLAKLLPQITPECTLLILDNHSPLPVAETLEPLLRQFPEVNFRIVRNVVNVGAGANFMRCFESCDTPWMWLLGDDDEPSQNAIATILTTTDEMPDGVYCNFSSEVIRRPQPLIGHGFRQFMQKFDSYNSMLWVSTAVFRADKLRQNMMDGYEYLYSWSAHLTMVALALKTDEKFCLSDRQIVHYKRHEPEHFWSYIGYVSRMVVNMNLPLTPADRRSWGNILGEVIHPIAILGALAVKIQLGMIERENAVFTIDQICSTGLYYPRSLRKWLEGWTSRILIRLPRLALIVLRSVYRLIHFKPLMKDESFLYLLGREGVIVENGIPRARKPAPKVDKETGLSTEN